MKINITSSRRKNGKKENENENEMNKRRRRPLL